MWTGEYGGALFVKMEKESIGWNLVGSDDVREAIVAHEPICRILVKYESRSTFSVEQEALFLADFVF